ncbi:MAG: hypothetical protein VYE73_09595, partial [Acidobacteriota bacterium]|nr:hypothetical protein [Acidobacteriota bacterium]
MNNKPLLTAVAFAAFAFVAGNAQAQEGACVSGGEEAAVCFDVTSEEECWLEFYEGVTCEELLENELGEEWDGACVFPDPDEEDQCGLVWVETGELDSEDLCTLEFDGVYLGDGSTCESVPTLPMPALFILLLLVTGSALIVLRRS